ncbi:MAG TPA: uroporphyrinogen-III C-methyltransferase [Rhodanobacter sp.]|nr:uroporphyrinogen-III C-methyltransferase [Rhodanobacter sp.]
MTIPDEPTATRDSRPDSVPPVRARASAPVRTARTGGGMLALAILLALVAIAAAAYVGWRQWQQEQGSDASRRGAAALTQRIGALETTVAGISSERGSVDRRLNEAAQVNQSLRESLLSQAQRTRHLEDAVAQLAEKSLSGHDAMLLDETESLLRMASERYTLFHDAQGAAAAYTLADQTLAGVDDGAFTGLRQSIDAERDALAKSQPVDLSSTLQQLNALRGTFTQLPLKPLDTAASAPASDGWSRIGRALSSVVSVQRDNGAPLAVADARFARELTALDLAQAQAALLAYDGKAYTEALQRVDASLATWFDADANAVQQARATIRKLIAARPAGDEVVLGAALVELHNLRAVHALNASGNGPAHAASNAATGGARR